MTLYAVYRNQASLAEPFYRIVLQSPRHPFGPNQYVALVEVDGKIGALLVDSASEAFRFKDNEQMDAVLALYPEKPSRDAGTPGGFHFQYVHYDVRFEPERTFVP